MPTKKLTPEAAYAQFLKWKPFTYTVTGKFSDDHTIDVNLSKKNSILAAIERYKKNRNTKSSWMMLSHETIKNKAKDGKKQPTVHSGAQQIAVAIKVNRRTVTLQKLEFKELQRYEHVTLEIGGEKHHLNCSSEEKEVTICIYGPWNPVTGKVELYHYDEKALPGAPAMVDKYLEWNVDDKGNPTSPKATS